jgi:hypothetical protein
MEQMTQSTWYRGEVNLSGASMVKGALRVLKPGCREEYERLMSEAIPMHREDLIKDRAERPWLYTPDQLSPELPAVFARFDAERLARE